MVGRASRLDSAYQDEIGSKFIAPSAVPITPDGPVPREMTGDEVQELIEDFRAAARNAIEAGFDGAQIQGSGGYLRDQLFQPVSNKRTDRWGGSVEKRARFSLELCKTIAQDIGSSKVSIRLSPWSDFNSMGMDDPIPDFTYLVRQLRALDLGFLDLVEARIRERGRRLWWGQRRILCSSRLGSGKAHHNWWWLQC